MKSVVVSVEGETGYVMSAASMLIILLHIRLPRVGMPIMDNIGL